MGNVPLEIWALVASIASVILALVAIGLSFGFFWLSFRSSREIGETTGRLEEIVRILQREAFSALTRTQDRLLEHAWPEGMLSADTIRAEVEEKMGTLKADLKTETEGQVAELLERQKVGSEELRSELVELVGGAVDRSTRIEAQARMDALEHSILHFVRELHPGQVVTAGWVLEHISEACPGTTLAHVRVELDRLAESAEPLVGYTRVDVDRAGDFKVTPAYRRLPDST